MEADENWMGGTEHIKEDFYVRMSESVGSWKGRKFSELIRL